MESDQDLEEPPASWPDAQSHKKIHRNRCFVSPIANKLPGQVVKKVESFSDKSSETINAFLFRRMGLSLR
jgi:hypothetical protein